MKHKVACTCVAMMLGACTGPSSEEPNQGQPGAQAQAQAPGQATATLGAPAPGDPAAGSASGTAGDAASAGDAAGGDATPALPVGSDAAAATLAASELQLPSGWSGTGILARRTEKLPKRAPAWAKVSAEVVEHDGQRFLVATGYVTKIKDTYLSRSTAESRARAELARWTGQPRVSGGTISDFWRDPKSGDTAVRAELAVPPNWVPGAPLGAQP